MEFLYKQQYVIININIVIQNKLKKRNKIFNKTVIIVVMYEIIKEILYLVRRRRRERESYNNVVKEQRNGNVENELLWTIEQMI